MTRIVQLFGLASVIALSVVLFIAPKFDVEPVASTAPAPTEKRVSVNFANAAIIDRKADGHYWATANVDGTSVKFMVDTGASVVALTYRDAMRMGVSPDDLDYRWEIKTAGGITMGAAVTIDSIKIGRVEIEQVDAMVIRDGLEQSLLGMSFLGELYSYEFKQSTLIIRQ